MRDSHRPADDDVAGGRIHLRDAIDRVPVPARARFDVAPRSRLDLAPEVRKRLGALLDERAIFRPALEQSLCDAGEQRDVAADVRLDVQARNAGSKKEAGRIARYAEFDETDLLRRVDDDDVTAAAADLHQAAEQARVVGCGIAANQHV